MMIKLRIYTVNDKTCGGAMFKICSSFLICLMLFACSSMPKDWSGMSADEISAWKSAGFTSTLAQKWHLSGFNASEASDWNMNGFNLEDAIAWGGQKFLPQEAKTWRDSGFDLEDAVDSRNNGLTPIQKN
ncbi:hypothetical protein [Shewanella xiamenensis]|uniref:hypothetical protein n=1 Tax=Shewanella xiamenensis TaxID=332186 RepID=UPI001E2E3064|nr:hypothetical protein [Shewanella xiamenensis]MCL1072217.1 hypothetical protein [Shewanella xiamenensis]MCR4535737.1 hypothetical protein [Shewanella xiamenensis]WHF55272.1 hypothetical protein OCF84_18135 [Shewanella xiamenensis]